MQKTRSEYVLWFSCNSKIHLSLHIIRHGFGVGRPCILVVRDIDNNLQFVSDVMSKNTALSR